MGRVGVTDHELFHEISMKSAMEHVNQPVPCPDEWIDQKLAHNLDWTLSTTWAIISCLEGGMVMRFLLNQNLFENVNENLYENLFQKYQLWNLFQNMDQNLDRYLNET